MAKLKRIQPCRADHTPQPKRAADVAAGGIEYDPPGAAAHNRVAKGVQGFIVFELAGHNKKRLLPWRRNSRVL
ncbi:hypothetical protein MesoLj131c_38340 [Mesorhizobium sp. 131-3-5]|nr:hypothetical protein MesoLj131c_38340 [Mesorhizobium sp. 131-3-5]